MDNTQKQMPAPMPHKSNTWTLLGVLFLLLFILSGLLNVYLFMSWTASQEQIDELDIQIMEADEDADEAMMTDDEEDGAMMEEEDDSRMVDPDEVEDIVTGDDEEDETTSDFDDPTDDPSVMF